MLPDFKTYYKSILIITVKHIPSPGDLHDPGIEPVSPALMADSLPAELPGKPLVS